MEIISIVAATCLGMNVMMEARSEPIEGQLAVAQVTVRRSGYRPVNLCRTVMARRQFSWTSGTDQNGRRGMVQSDAWKQAQSVARRAILWGWLRHFQDYSNGATHYATDDITPYWVQDMIEVAHIGRHRFYKRKD